MESMTLVFISRYQENLQQLLSCCKEWTINREYKCKCKNMIYTRDSAIMVANGKHPEPKQCLAKCKEVWWKEGEIHRDHIDLDTGFTLPAIIYYDDDTDWYLNGKRNRKDIDPKTGLLLPTITRKSGLQVWHKDGKCHRDEIDPETGEDLPANITNNEFTWYKEGYCERGDDKPAIIHSDGTKIWCKKGKFHREGAPAVIFANGFEEWYIDGKLIDPPS